MSGARRFQDLRPQLGSKGGLLRGWLEDNVSLAPLTWFRVGGPAQLFFQPADEDDLALFLGALPDDVPVTVIGLASNLLVRDGGVPGAVVRLSARGFGTVAVDGARLVAGAALPDVKLARAAADAGLAGLAFLRGIPGSIGGALRMNAGSYGTETGDRLLEAHALDRTGAPHTLGREAFGFSYRHCSVPDDWIFTRATFAGEPGDRADIQAEMDTITERREATQPVKSRTGGSTFKNPPGEKAWQLIERAGCRGLREGSAQVSEQHCNFLINTGEATAAELERLGETVRARVLDATGARLEWEIRRIGVAPDGVAGASPEEPA